MNDAELMKLVRTAFQVHEPVPDEVFANARAAFGWQQADAAVARLTGDERLAGAVTALRGGSRMLTFAGNGLTVEVEITVTGQVFEVAGQLLPPTAAEVRVRHTDGELAGQAGPAGQFVVDGVPPGLVSLSFQLPDAASIVTSWVRL